jgi:hypothetical protein
MTALSQSQRSVDQLLGSHQQENQVLRRAPAVASAAAVQQRDDLAAGHLLSELGQGGVLSTAS